jgi:hypothetical protein
MLSIDTADNADHALVDTPRHQPHPCLNFSAASRNQPDGIAAVACIYGPKALLAIPLKKTRKEGQAQARHADKKLPSVRRG